MVRFVAGLKDGCPRQNYRSIITPVEEKLLPYASVGTLLALQQEQQPVEERQHHRRTQRSAEGHTQQHTRVRGEKAFRRFGDRTPEPCPCKYKSHSIVESV
jgi:hypothetical protein